MKEIEIIINVDGTSEIDLKGFHGKGCSKVTEELVKAIGGEVQKRTKKCDYYQSEPKQKVKQRV